MSRSKPKKWSADEVETARVMWADNKTGQQIADFFGLTRKQVVSLVKNKRDIFPARVKRSKPTSEQQAIIQELSLIPSHRITAEYVAGHLPQFSLAAIQARANKIRQARTAAEKLREKRDEKIKAHKLRIQQNGCQKLVGDTRCNAHTFGRFCEEHVRDAFPRDMSPVQLVRYF